MSVFILCVLLLAASEVAYSQISNIGSCQKLTRDDFGRSDFLSADGIVAQILQNDEMTIQVRIVGFNIVCEAAGLMKGTISSISVIITYEHLDTATTSPPMNRTEQFQMDCAIRLNGSASFSPPVVLLGGGLHTVEPNGTLDTELNDNCGSCADPTIFQDTEVDIDTHCFRTCIDQ